MNGALFAVIGFASFLINGTTFFLQARRQHRQRQSYRTTYDGWTLPWFLCGAYWIGWEDRIPDQLKRHA